MHRQVLILHVAFLLSGAAGLGYEIVWSRQLAAGLGHEYPSLLAVLAGYFGGFALGAFALDRVVSRSHRPGAWYASLELVVAAWAIATVFLMPALNRAMARWIGIDAAPVRQAFIAFLAALLVMLPATMAMGGTLPAIERLCSRRRQRGHCVGGLYAVNTLGAVVGVVATAFVLAPSLGFSNTLYALAALNALAAGICLAGPARQEARITADAINLEAPSAGARLGMTAFVTGLIGVGLEVLAVRVLAQVTQGTIYTFASILAVYLVGTAIGAALYQQFLSNRTSERLLGRLLIGLSLASMAAGWALTASRSLYDSLLHLVGQTIAGSIATEMIVAMSVLFLPAVLMGATFSHIAQISRTSRGGIGAMLGLNTLGSAMAPPIVGVMVLPAIGDRYTLAVLAAGYLVLTPFRRHRIGMALAIVALLVMVLPRAPLIDVSLAPGDRVVHAVHGPMADVAVIERPEPLSTPVRLLKVDNRFQMGGTGGGAFAERRLAHIPLLLHPEPHRALFLGLGTGITIASAAEHPSLRHADGVELLAEIADVLPDFGSENAALFDDGRLAVHIGDARRFVRAQVDRYDVIVADLFHPARDGASSLYTVEHFEAVQRSLAPGGLFCQWLPLYQLDAGVLRTIVRTYLHVFPHARAFLCHFNPETPMLGLIAGDATRTYPANWMRLRVPDGRLSKALIDVALANEFQLFGLFVTDEQNLADFAGAGLLNTDDRPVVAFEAPRHAYAIVEDGFPVWRELTSQVGPPTFEWIKPAVGDAGVAPATPSTAQFLARLSAYARARDLYMTAADSMSHIGEQSGIAPLLQAVRTSPDFTLAALRLRLLVQEISQSNPDAARRLLTDLNTAEREARNISSPSSKEK